MKYLIHLDTDEPNIPVRTVIERGLAYQRLNWNKLTVETHTREGQDSCHEWCVRTFPHFADHAAERQTRLKAILEEAIELCSAGGMHDEQIASQVSITLKRLPQTGEELDASTRHTRLRDESADVQLALYALAGHEHFRLQEAVDEKMRLNRSRPQEYYDQKQALKPRKRRAMNREDNYHRTYFFGQAQCVDCKIQLGPEHMSQVCPARKKTNFNIALKAILTDKELSTEGMVIELEKVMDVYYNLDKPRTETRSA